MKKYFLHFISLAAVTAFIFVPAHVDAKAVAIKKVQGVSVQGSGSSKTIEWKKASGAQKYTVKLYKKNSWGSWDTVATKKTNNKNTKFSSLSSGSYRFRIQGTKASRVGQWSGWNTFTIAAPIISAPHNSTPSISGVVKKSVNDICHEPGSTYYNRTIHYTSYSTLADCLASGGRLPLR